MKRLRFINFHIWRVLFFVLFICFAGILVTSHLRRDSVGQYSIEILKEMFVECSGDNAQTFSYSCARLKLRPYVTMRNLTNILEDLEIIFNSHSVTLRTHGALSCHPSAHLVGELAIVNGLSYRDVIAHCSRKCDYGCSHAAFIEHLRKNPSQFAHIGQLCEDRLVDEVKRDSVSCAHIVGHSVAELYASTFQKALSSCDQFSEGYMRQACGQGAIMEYFVGLPDRPKNTPFTEGDVLDFCEKLEGSYKKQCFDGAGFFTVKADRVTSLGETICDAVPEDSRLPCYYSLAGTTYFLYRTDPQGMLLFCEQFPFDEKMKCIEGAIETSVGEDDAFTFGNSLCTSLRDANRQSCYAFLGQQIEWAKGAKVRNEACSALSVSEYESCMKAQ